MGCEDCSELLDKQYNDLRQCLIETLIRVHGENFTDSWIRQPGSEFLEKFTKIFSLNYDLLTYWATVAGGKFKDGFGYPDYEGAPNELIWGPHKHLQNIFYLHGSLPFYKKDNSNDIFKHRNKNGLNLLDVIANSVFPPLFVCEGTHEEKMNLILGNSYLKFCYDKLSELQEDLIIFGSNLNLEYDKHIVEALKNNSSQKIFILSHSDNDEEARNKFQKQKDIICENDSKKVEIIALKYHPWRINL